MVKWSERNRLHVVVDVLPSGEIRENMSLTKETFSVDEVQRLLKQQLGFEKILLDTKYLLVMEGETVPQKVSCITLGWLLKRLNSAKVV